MSEFFSGCRNLSEILSEICPKFWKFGPKILCPKIKCPKFIGPKFLEVKVKPTLPKEQTLNIAWILDINQLDTYKFQYKYQK